MQRRDGSEEIVSQRASAVASRTLASQAPCFTELITDYAEYVPELATDTIGQSRLPTWEADAGGSQVPVPMAMATGTATPALEQAGFRGLLCMLGWAVGLGSASSCARGRVVRSRYTTAGTMRTLSLRGAASLPPAGSSQMRLLPCPGAALKESGCGFRRMTRSAASPRRQRGS